ncbi:MAG: DUF996 domain-containing protein [Gammaproteobacteria bacterium]
MEQSTKLLGGISYIVLIVFGFVGIAAFPLHLITLAAAICVLVAFIQGGNQLGRPEVKNNVITALVLYIVAVVLFIFTVGLGLMTTIMTGGLGAVTFGAGMIIGGIIGWILAIVAAWFWYKASVALTEATGVSLYKIGGLLIFIGAILLIVGIGVILIFVGEILQCIAFFSTPEKGAVTASAPPQAPAV